jgi:hypothetical protein
VSKKETIFSLFLYNFLLSFSYSAVYNALTRIMLRSEAEGQEMPVPNGSRATIPGNEFRQRVASRQRHDTALRLSDSERMKYGNLVSLGAQCADGVRDGEVD